MPPRAPVAALLVVLSAAACAAPDAAPPPAAVPAAPPDLLAAFAARDLVDLTHPLGPDAVYWPGEGYFAFEARPLATWERDRASSRAYSVPEHYGTHVDAPVHFLPRQRTMDAVPARELVAPVVVFDLVARAAADPDAVLTAADVAAWEAEHGPVPEGALAILRTGWEHRWGDARAYRGSDAAGRLRFPGFGLDAARVLLRERGCVGLGIDTLSIDRGRDHEYPVHRLGSGMNRWFIENLRNLDRLPATGAVAVVGVVPIVDGTGGPARVLAWVPRSD